MSRWKSFLIIILSGIVSTLTAVAWVDFGALELGVLYFFLVPVFMGVITLALFLVGDFFWKDYRFGVTTGLVVLNILTGIFMRLDFYCHLTW